MKTYTKEEQRQNLEGACKALEENPKKAKGRMRDEDGGRCCLCVMEDYAMSIDPDIKKGGVLTPSLDLEGFYGLKRSENLHGSVFGFNFDFKDGILASEYNDNKNNHTHKEIAARIRRDFL